MTKPIRTIGDNVLITKTDPIVDFNESLMELTTDMWWAMKQSHGVGLAANQIGISLSVFAYDGGPGQHGFICNPEITPIGEAMIEEMEGCLSVPGQFHLTPRYKQVRLLGKTIWGRTIDIEADGLLARIFQHETDHLNGKLYISRLPTATQVGIVLGRQPM